MNERIGILDWGIGAVGIRKLLAGRSSVPVVYLSDTGVTPYGKMRHPELISRLVRVFDFFAERGITNVVVGCNAASTALPFIDSAAKVIGMIEPAADLVVRQHPERLGLIGGRRTVLSGAYRKAFRERGIRVEQRIAQPLSALIEAGDLGESLRNESRRILSPLRNCSHILLACTHYPAAADVLRQFVSERTVLLDPAPAVVDEILKWNIEPSNSADEFLTTGDPRNMMTAAKKAFGYDIDRPEKIKL